VEELPMSAKAFRNLLRHISTIDAKQKERIFWELKNELFPATITGKVVDELRKKRFKEGFCCPHCESKRVIRYGKAQGKQRYQCKECRKTFTDFTNTPLQRTQHPRKWTAFIQFMAEGMILGQ
jgi:ribosomal protein L37AE/L43A